MNGDFERGPAEERFDARFEVLGVHHERRALDDATIVQRADSLVHFRAQSEVIGRNGNPRHQCRRSILMSAGYSRSISRRIFKTVRMLERFESPCFLLK